MADVPPVLNYASPVDNRRIRTPNPSRVDWEDIPGGVRVVEHLTNRSQAIGAICFAVFTLLMLGAATLASVLPSLSRARSDQWFMAAFLAAFWLGEAALIVAVINQTWRWMIVEVRGGELVLINAAPIRRSVRRWTAADIIDVQLCQTGITVQQQPLSEIQVRFHRDVTLLLFRDHYEEWLAPVVLAMRRAIGMR